MSCVGVEFFFKSCAPDATDIHLEPFGILLIDIRLYYQSQYHAYFHC